MAINGKAKDLTGQTFGFWKVISLAEDRSRHGHRMFLCQCICGKTKVLRGSMLTNGTSISCRCQTSKLKNITHDMSDTRTYSTWTSMRNRCNNPKADNYDRYGGRGIKVCDDWNHSFEKFFADMGERPKNTTIDRIDGSKGYFKGNCRWASHRLQTLNRDETVWLEYKGEILCISDMAKKYKLTRSMISNRLKKGMTTEQAIETPREKMMFEILKGGVVYSLDNFNKEFGLSRTSLARKRDEGMTMQESINFWLLKKGHGFTVSVIEKPYSWGKRKIKT